MSGAMISVDVAERNDAADNLPEEQMGAYVDYILK
jgi:hypothetical protein